MRFLLIEKEPLLARWYSGKVGTLVEYVPKYDDEEYYGVRDDEGYINFVVRGDVKLMKTDLG